MQTDMHTSHSLRCKCGLVQGQVELRGISNRIICYCSSCQAFAKFLGAPHEVLDRNGGSEIIQLAASRVSLSNGTQHIAAVRLTEQGMLRWYASCCNTPLGNTMPSHTFCFVGLLRNCLDSQALEPSFGTLRARLNSAEAIGEPKPGEHGLIATIARIAAIALPKRLSGGYKRTPFFNAQGAPIVVPRVLLASELAQLKAPQVTN
jgi:hypothetical protein